MVRAVQRLFNRSTPDPPLLGGGDGPRLSHPSGMAPRTARKGLPRPLAGAAAAVVRRATRASPPRWWLALTTAVVVAVLVGGAALNASYLRVLLQGGEGGEGEPAGGGGDMGHGGLAGASSVDGREPLSVVGRGGGAVDASADGGSGHEAVAQGGSDTKGAVHERDAVGAPTNDNGVPGTMAGGESSSGTVGHGSGVAESGADDDKVPGTVADGSSAPVGAGSGGGEVGSAVTDGLVHGAVADGKAAPKAVSHDAKGVGATVPSLVPLHTAPIGRHLYMSTKGESVTAMDNLCVAGDGRLYTLPQPTVCGWMFKASGALNIPLASVCAKKDSDSFAYMKLSPPVEVSRLNDPSVPALRHRVNLDGVTVFLTLAAAGTNIAHYTGSMTHLFHLLRHASRYGLAAAPTRIVIVVVSVTSPPFLDPHSFHSIILRAASGGGPIFHRTTAPAFPLPAEPPAAESAVGGAPGGGPTVWVSLNGKNVNALVHPNDSALCMRRAVVPNFPRGRWFIPAADLPVPSGLLPPRGAPLATMQQAMADAVMWRRQQMEAEGDAPADATPWRDAVFAALVPPLTGGRPRMTRRLTYLARHLRRAFDEPSEARMRALLDRVGTRHRVEVDVVSFKGMVFSDQVRAVVHSAVLVGIHGANLVNALYAPQGAHLVEIFPRRFSHDMYIRGGEAGLGYTAVSLIEPGVADYKGLAAHDSLRSCMNNDPDCKVWYRADRRELVLGPQDEAAVEAALDKAVAQAQPPP